MKSLAFLFGFVSFYTSIFQGADTVDYTGGSSGKCNSPSFKQQICPEGGLDKYVRIKTYNGKYWYATESSCFRGDNSLCVKTRCCGSKPSVDQHDVTKPGRRTTFKMRCFPRTLEITKKGIVTKTFHHTASFEVLRANDKSGSGKYLCSTKDVSRVFTRDGRDNCRWAIHQWRGSVIGLEPIMVWKWAEFEDDGYGTVYARSNTENRRTPLFSNAYTLEIVAKECVDVGDSEKIQAAKDNATPTECETDKDRCYMFNGYGSSTQHGATCFYRKDSKCFQTNVGSRQLCDDEDARPSAVACESAQANCCYDYAEEQCYQAKSIS